MGVVFDKRNICHKAGAIGDRQYFRQQEWCDLLARDAFGSGLFQCLVDVALHLTGRYLICGGDRIGD